MLKLEAWRIGVNAVAPIAASFCIYLLARLYLLTRVRAWLVMIAPFALLVVTRLGVVFQIDFFLVNSRVISVSTYIGFALAFGMLYRSVVDFYGDDGD